MYGNFIDEMVVRGGETGRLSVRISPWVADLLTVDEIVVLKNLMSGCNVTEIARSQGRNLKTISSQKVKLYRKLRIKSDMTLYKDLLEREAIKFFRD